MIKSNVISIERDMKPKEINEGDSLSAKVFKHYPLVGMAVISDELQNKINEAVKKYIESVLLLRAEKEEKKSYKKSTHELVALAVVNYAKKWNNYEEGKFSRYIAAQFGYKDDSGKVWGIITESIDIAFNQNNKFFITRYGDREFYETIMAHSFGPNKAWFPLFDLLFDFYKDNLEWNYVPGDPIYSRLVSVLDNYFNNVAEEDSYLIASHNYNLRVGIRRIVQERPGYAAHLFEIIVKRINSHIQNNASAAKNNYCYFLLDQWFAEKISSAEVNNDSIRHKKAVSEVALTYESISPKFILDNNQLALSIPSIRLNGDYDGSAYASIYYEDELIGSYMLETVGNELGQSIKHRVITLTNDREKVDSLRFSLIITKGEETLYDSKKKLWRTIILFKDNKEVSLNRIKQGTYKVFAPDIKKLDGNNIEVTSLSDTLCWLNFGKQFSLIYDKNTVAIDETEITDVRIVKPNTVQHAYYANDGIEYSIVADSANIIIYAPNVEQLKKYQVIINSDNISATYFWDKKSNNKAIIPLFSNDELCSISLVNIATDKIVLRADYIFIPDFKYSFNQSCYMTSDELQNAVAKVFFSDEKVNVKCDGGRSVEVTYNAGLIYIEVPGIFYEYKGLENIYFNKYVCVWDITELSEIIFDNKSEDDFEFNIGNLKYTNPNKISINDFCCEYFTSIMQEMKVKSAEREQVIGYLICEDCFVNAPIFNLIGNNLQWDGGKSYLGNPESRIRLELIAEDICRYSFNLQIGKNIIQNFYDEAFIDDNYVWHIYINNKLALSGEEFIGNKDRIRFRDSIIKIRRVTEDIDGSSKPLSIKEVCIDQIKDGLLQYVPSEEDYYYVYSGHMYWINRYGEKVYYSHRYVPDKNKYKVNPVKIIYISDKYLRIITEDDEGIYCYYNDDDLRRGFEITDKEPTTKAQGKKYKDILFYLYTKEQKRVYENKFNEENDDLNCEDRKQLTTAIVSPEENIAPVSEGKSNIVSEDIVEVNNSVDEQPVDEIQYVDVLQEEVIQANVEERIIVNAGPGTGKTWTLIEKVIYMIDHGVDPSEIQVLCFSRAAVEVVYSRLKQAIMNGRIGVEAGLVDVRSFDSFATQLLYWVKDSEYSEISSSFSIEELNYDQRIRKFTDIIKKKPELISQCAHLIVDEAQDLVLERAEMVLALIDSLPECCGITLLGDKCQAIYDYQVKIGTKSSDFYKKIENGGQFKLLSFAQNFRQCNELSQSTDDIRNAILSNKIEKCDEVIKCICDVINNWEVDKLRNIDVKSMEKLTSLGTLAILTRSNAQALMVSRLLRSKNIKHAVQRRLRSSVLSGWIAYLFNNSEKTIYERDAFICEINKYCPEIVNREGFDSLWDDLTEYMNSESLVSVNNLLKAVQKMCRNRSLYLADQEDKVIVSTVHRSKGREYDTVLLLSNMLSETKNSMEEYRIGYVSLSRAKKQIYTVDLDKIISKTIGTSRRNYAFAFNKLEFGQKHLKYFEFGKEGDCLSKAFACYPMVQQYIRDNYESVIGKEIYLNYVSNGDGAESYYEIVLKEQNMVVGRTGDGFMKELSYAIKEIKNLPRHAKLYERLYPKRFRDLFITDITTEIGMVTGNEKDIVFYGDYSCWNGLIIEGYMIAEY